MIEDKDVVVRGNNCVVEGNYGVIRRRICAVVGNNSIAGDNDRIIICEVDKVVRGKDVVRDGGI